MKRLTATLQKEEDMYVARCPEIGTVSQGRSIKSALANLKEATELYLEYFPHTIRTKTEDNRHIHYGHVHKKKDISTKE